MIAELEKDAQRLRVPAGLLQSVDGAASYPPAQDGPAARGASFEFFGVHVWRATRKP